MATLIDLLAVRDRGTRDGFLDAFARLDTDEDLTSFSPRLSGEDVMALLGLSSGPAVGRAIELLRRRRIEHGPGSAEEERRFLLENWAG